MRYTKVTANKSLNLGDNIFIVFIPLLTIKPISLFISVHDNALHNKLYEFGRPGLNET